MISSNRHGERMKPTTSRANPTAPQRRRTSQLTTDKDEPARCLTNSRVTSQQDKYHAMSHEHRQSPPNFGVTMTSHYTRISTENYQRVASH
eukprot:m.75742 g.75742  ORF g.75742 m.75742 type:complete len:91 (+) comp16183_c0_seq2:3132-3404(+)